jgi:hypothetical protein
MKLTTHFYPNLSNPGDHFPDYAAALQATKDMADKVGAASFELDDGTNREAWEKRGPHWEKKNAEGT